MKKLFYSGFILTVIVSLTFYACQKNEQQSFQESPLAKVDSIYPSDLEIAAVTNIGSGAYTLSIPESSVEAIFSGWADSNGYDSSRYISQSIMDTIFLADTIPS